MRISIKGGLCEVVGVAKHSETLEEMVVYRALYGQDGLWVRPASMWLEEGRTTTDRVIFSWKNVFFGKIWGHFAPVNRIPDIRREKPWTKP